MISLKTLSLLLFLVLTSQYTSARPSQIVDKENYIILSRSVDSHNPIESRGLPFDLSQIGSTKSFGGSNSFLPAETPFLGKKHDSKQVDELPFDLSSTKDEKSSGNLPFDMPLFKENKFSKETSVDTPVDSSQLTKDSAFENLVGKTPVKMPLFGKKGDTLGGGDFPFGFSRRSEIVPSSTESQGTPFGSSFLGGKNPFSQLQSGFPTNLIPSKTDDKTFSFGKLPFTMPSFGDEVGNLGSGVFPTSFPFFTSKESSSDQK